MDKILVNGILYEQSGAIKSGYETDLSKDATCYYVNYHSESHSNSSFAPEYIDNLIECGNYYNSLSVCQNIAYIQKVYAKIRRWQAVNDEPITNSVWADDTVDKFYISFIYVDGTPVPKVTASRYYRDFNQVYFTTEEKAEEALLEFQEDLNTICSLYTRLDELEN